MKKQALTARLDATNLAGISSLMNPMNIRKDVNLKNVEEEIMGKSTKDDIDPVAIFDEEVNRLANDLGIDLMESDSQQSKSHMKTMSSSKTISSSKTTPSKTPERSLTSPTKLATIDLDGCNCADDCDAEVCGGCSCHECDCDEDCDGEACGGCPCHECDCDEDCDDECECDCHNDASNDASDDASDEGSDDASEGSEAGSDAEEDIDALITKLERNIGTTPKPKKSEIVMPGREKRSKTNEQESRRHINSIMSDIRGETKTSFGVERERVQDIKASKLEQIAQLKTTLEDEGVDCSSVSNPTNNSEMSEIDSVLGILRLKNDRNRYSSLAEEVILGLAEGIETVFDGSRAFPGTNWRPDYTGYHNTVNAKLHRMRFETSQVVGEIVQKYNIGPTSRIIMELLPSFVLYPRQQKKQKAKPGLAGEIGDSRFAYNAIKDADKKKTLDDIRNL